MGEKITDKGLGNGTSLIIMIGILARLPQSFHPGIGGQINPYRCYPVFSLLKLLFLLPLSWDVYY